MRRINCTLLIAFLLAPLMFLGNPAYGMDISQMETIVANSRGSVDCTLARLQSVLVAGDRQTVQLTQQALDLAVANYAIASESLEKARAGETVSDSTMAACNDIADELGDACDRIADGSLAIAERFYNMASTKYDSLPPPSNPGKIPSGLADIRAQILAASSESAAILAGGRTPGRTDSLGSSRASEI